jgi:hypothetical protein
MFEKALHSCKFCQSFCMSTRNLQVCLCSVKWTNDCNLYWNELIVSSFAAGDSAILDVSHESVESPLRVDGSMVPLA